MPISRFLSTAAFAVLASSSALWADVKVPSIFSNHMVLEKAASVPFWGKAEPGEKVTVTINGQSASATADAKGVWSTSLNLKDSGPGPFELIIEGKNKISIADVLVGEVWLASGQSNMEWVLKATTDAEKEAAQSANPLLRQFTVTRRTAATSGDDVEGKWSIAGPETTLAFGAVSYYFSKRLQNELKSPVGVILSAWGGTPVEAWTPASALDTDPDLKAASARIASQLETFPDERKAFINDMRAWVEKNGRTDPGLSDAEKFAGKTIVAADWTKVNVPGPIQAKGLPEAGVVWVRTPVTMSAAAGSSVQLVLPLVGFDAVYWNGKLLKQTTLDDFESSAEIRRGPAFNIAAADILPGENVLAIRFYEPVSVATIKPGARFGDQVLDGEWLAKAQVSFPAVEPAVIAAAPKPPQRPPALQYSPGYLYNGMIAPLVPYAISGFIWYQGESNANRAFQYRTAFPLMITSWREVWKQRDLPFYFCQLANYTAKSPTPADSTWAELREAQNRTLSLPNTGQAVLIDVGESDDIHPRNKKDVGERLARIALARDYGKSVPYAGPTFDSVAFADGKAIVTFKNTDGGLVAPPLPKDYVKQSLKNKTAPLVANSPGSQVEGFAICGEDKAWVWADAKIDGNTVVVWSAKVPKPIAVRYAWSNNPTCNLANGAGLPASPFRTDDFPLTTAATKW